MLPIFVQDFFIQMDILLFRVQNKGKCCRFFSNFFHIDVVIRSGSEQGGVLPIFLQGGSAAHFSPRFSLGFNFKTRGNAAHFSPIIVHPNRLVSGSKQGEMLPFFLQEGYIQINFACCSQSGKCCPFFSKKISTYIDF